MARIDSNTPALRIVKGLADDPPEMGYMAIPSDVKWWQWPGILYMVFKILRQEVNSPRVWGYTPEDWVKEQFVRWAKMVLDE